MAPRLRSSESAGASGVGHCTRDTSWDPVWALAAASAIRPANRLGRTWLVTYGSGRVNVNRTSGYSTVSTPACSCSASGAVRVPASTSSAGGWTVASALCSAMAVSLVVAGGVSAASTSTADAAAVSQKIASASAARSGNGRPLTATGRSVAASSAPDTSSASSCPASDSYSTRTRSKRRRSSARGPSVVHRRRVSVDPAPLPCRARTARRSGSPSTTPGPSATSGPFRPRQSARSPGSVKRASAPAPAAAPSCAGGATVTGSAHPARAIFAAPDTVQSGDWLLFASKSPGDGVNGQMTCAIAGSYAAATFLRSSEIPVPNAFSVAVSAARSDPPVAAKTNVTRAGTSNDAASASLPGSAAGGAGTRGSSTSSSVTRALATVVSVRPASAGADEKCRRPPLMRRPQ